MPLIFFVLLTLLGFGLMAMSGLRLYHYWQTTTSPSRMHRHTKRLGVLEAAYRQQYSRANMGTRTITADDAFWSTDKHQIQRWAIENLSAPASNWNIILSGALPLQDIIDLASADALSTQWQTYFLRSAYIRIGDMRRQAERNGQRDDINAVADIISAAGKSQNQDVVDWGRRARRYLDDNASRTSTDRLFTWHQDHSSHA